MQSKTLQTVWHAWFRAHEEQRTHTGTAVRHKKCHKLHHSHEFKLKFPPKRNTLPRSSIDVDNEAEVQTHAKQPAIEGIDDLLEHPRSGSEVINYYSSLFNHRQL